MSNFQACRLGGSLIVSLLYSTIPAHPASIDAESGKGPSGAPLSVSVKRSREMCFKDYVEVTGTLVARREVDVGAIRDGLVVSRVLAEPMDMVAPGQVLAELVPMEGAGGASLLRSPVAGVVGRSGAIVGMSVSARQGPLFRILAGGDLDLRAEAPVNQLQKLSTGQRVIVKPLGAPDVAGVLHSIAPSVDPASQLGRVKIAVTTTRPLRPGTFARGIIETGERCGTGIPYSAIMYQPEGAIVHVVIDNRVLARKVELGLISGKEIEIRSGLSRDDLVVTRAGPFLRDGDAVNPVDVPAVER